MRRLLALLCFLLLAHPAGAANWYVSSAGYTAVAQWAAGHAYSVGSYVRQLATPAVNSERVFKATSVSGTGTSGGSEPTWGLTAGATTTDNAGANQIVWTEVTGKESEQAAGAWHAPFARINAVPSGRLAGSDQMFLSQDHAETQTTALSIGYSAPFSILAVNRSTGSVPPVSADLSTSATVTTTGSTAITLGSAAGPLYVRGVTFTAGDSTNNGNVIVGGGLGAVVTCDRCALVLGGSNSLAKIQLTSTNNLAPGLVFLKDTTMQFASTSQSISYNAGIAQWFNTSSYPGGSNITGATVPTNLILGGVNGILYAHGLDLSAQTNNLFNANSGTGQTYLYDCKLASTVTLPSASLSQGATSLTVDNCDDATNNRNYRFLRASTYGITQQSSTVARTGGASDGTTPISWKATGNGTALTPYALPTITKRYTTLASPIVVTVYFVTNAASGLTNAQVWSEVEALTASTAPISSTTTNRVSDLLASTSASTVTSDTSCWDTAAPARQNSHAYTAGDAIAVSSNTCRIFIATGSGTSAGSLPGGYATAVDGGSVTDSGVTFRAGVRQKLAVTVTPQEAGYAMVTPMLAAATTIFVDPKLSP